MLETHRLCIEPLLTTCPESARQLAYEQRSPESGLPRELFAHASDSCKVESKLGRRFLPGGCARSISVGGRCIRHVGRESCSDAGQVGLQLGTHFPNLLLELAAQVSYRLAARAESSSNNKVSLNRAWLWKSDAEKEEVQPPEDHDTGRFWHRKLVTA